MKNKINLLSLVGTILAISLVSCGGDNSKNITICASELPHAKILNEVIKDLVKEDGYNLSVTVLDWTIQNDAVANNEYDANYFEHIPYLNTYKGTSKLIAACKVHYEKLCLYSSDKDTNKVLDDGESIELVNDPSNIERALNLLASYNILTINPSNYNSNKEFTNFDTTNPTSCVTFLNGYKNCTLTCVKESNLCASLPDYNFGIIPGNTALTGLGESLSSRIVLSEKASDELISEKANIITVKEENKNSEKTKELVKVFADSRVKKYIESTFGDSVLYHYENLIA
jgi:D-methionine transport system substrate-binding protein